MGYVNINIETTEFIETALSNLADVFQHGGSHASRSVILLSL